MLSRSVSPSKELMNRLKNSFRSKSPNSLAGRSRPGQKGSRSTHGSRDSSVDSQPGRSSTLPRTWNKQRQRSKSTINLNSNVTSHSGGSSRKSMSRPSTPDRLGSLASRTNVMVHVSPRRCRRPSDFSLPTRIPAPDFMNNNSNRYKAGIPLNSPNKDQPTAMISSTSTCNSVDSLKTI